MSFHLKSILAGQGHIREVIVRPEFSERRADILLEVFPVEAKFVRYSPHRCNLGIGEAIETELTIRIMICTKKEEGPKFLFNLLDNAQPV